MSAAALVAFAPAVTAHADPPAGVVLAGHVLDASKPVPATVTLTAWPDVAALDHLPDGAVVGTRRIATATTGVDGSYSLAPALSSLPHRFREADGTVNVELEIGSDIGHAQLSLPIAVSAASPAARVTTTAVPGTRPADVDVDLSRGDVTDSLSTAPVRQPSRQPSRSRAITSVATGRPATDSASARRSS